MTAKAPWMKYAESYVGLREIIGSKHEKKIVQFFKEAGFPHVRDDETAWCAAFLNAMLQRAGYKGSRSLMARSFLKWGKRLSKPEYGCVVVIKRGAGWQGHVGFFLERKGGRVRVLSGNQANAVTDTGWYSEDDVLGYRWPVVKVEGVLTPGRAKTAVVVGAGAGADAANTANETVNSLPPPEVILDHVGTAKQVTDTLGLTDKIIAVLSQPRFLLAAAVVVAVGVYLYLRWRNKGASK